MAGRCCFCPPSGRPRRPGRRCDGAERQGCMLRSASRAAASLALTAAGAAPPAIVTTNWQSRTCSATPSMRRELPRSFNYLRESTVEDGSQDATFPGLRVGDRLGMVSSVVLAGRAIYVFRQPMRRFDRRSHGTPRSTATRWLGQRRGSGPQRVQARAITAHLIWVNATSDQNMLSVALPRQTGRIAGGAGTPSGPNRPAPHHDQCRAPGTETP
jgi:hypothetical protein